MVNKPAHQLVAGVDYPRNFVEFQEFFPNEAVAYRYLEQLRWPEGFVCPRCGEVRTAWRSERGLLVCSSCRKQASVTAGTIFEKTRKPLQVWFHVAWEITNSKQGTNALTIQRRIGLPNYKTAWSWLHKFRRAMVRPDRDLLAGEVEVDETYVGGEEEGVSGRQTRTKSIVVIAVELQGNRPGRIRLSVVPDVSSKSLVPFVKEAVEPGSVVKTDGWSGYGSLKKNGYTHEVTTLSSSESPAVVVMPKVHLVAALLKRWLLGTFHGGVSREHLVYYLDEFTFRFNRRTSRARGLLFYRLLEQAVQTTPATTRQLFLGAGRGPPPRNSRSPDHKM